MDDSVIAKIKGRLKLDPSKIIKTIDTHQFVFMLIIIILALVIRFIYVFQFTDYQNYLQSDMGAYWGMALERVSGNDTNINQWIIWPPFYHIALSYFIRLIDLIGLQPLRLEITLGFHILLAALSVFFLYGITKKIANGRTIPALVVAAAYAFCYPLIYLNAFILTENLAIPLLIFSIWCIFNVSESHGKETAEAGSRVGPRLRLLSIPLIDYLWLVSSGLSLAIATAARPAFGLLGILFVFFLTGVKVFRIVSIIKRRDVRSAVFSGVVRAVVFSLVFFAFLGLVIMENMRISQGRLSGLGSGGGFNFYLAQSKKYWLESNFDGYNYVLVPPGTVDQPERGQFMTSVPLYDQAYYYDLGLRYLKDHPQNLIKNLLSFETLFFGPLLPSYPSARYMRELLPVFKMKLFLMAVSILILLPFMIKNPRLRSRYFFFMLALPVCLLALNLLYNVEQRYLYSFTFALYILFIFAVVSFFQGRRLILRCAYYAGALALVLVTPPLIKEINAQNLKDTVRVTLTQCADTVPSFDFHEPPPKGPQPIRTMTTQVNSVRFRGPWTLVHEDKGPLGNFDERFFGVLESTFQVRDPGIYVFKVFVNEAARLIIDDEVIGEARWSREGGYGAISISRVLEKDTEHTLVIEYIEDDGDAFLVGTYQKEGTDDEDYHYVGESSPYLQFSAAPQTFRPD